MNWAQQSFVSMLLLIPVWMSIEYLAKKHGLRPEVFAIWYFLGISVLTAVFGGLTVRELFPGWQVLVIMSVVVAIGTMGNILLYRAVPGAPSGVPIAIVNVSSMGVFLASGVMSKWFPSYFANAKIDKQTLLGMILTIVGLALMLVKRRVGLS